MIVKIPKKLTGRPYSCLVNTDFIIDVHYSVSGKTLRINYPKGAYMKVSPVGTEIELEPLLDKLLVLLTGTAL